MGLRGEQGCSEAWTIEREAQRESEGKEKGRRRKRRKEADDRMDKKEDKNRRKEETGEERPRVFCWVSLRVLQGMRGERRPCGSQHNMQSNT